MTYSTTISSIRYGDSLANVVSGMGTDRDKLTYNRFVTSAFTVADLLSAYRSDWLAKKIVRIPAFDMCREWRSWKADAATIGPIEKTERKLNVRNKVRQAITMARLLGGAALIIGDGDGSPQTMLDPTKIQKGGLKYLAVVNRYQITTGEIDRDIASETYGEPSYYEVRKTDGTSTRLHPSRVIRFLGEEVPDADLCADAVGWGDSVLLAVRDAIEHVAGTSQGIAGLVQEAKLDVVSIPGLSALVSNEEDSKRLIARFRLAALAKSLQNTLILDKDEDFNRKQISFSDIPDVLNLFLQIASGAADIPATRLLSQAPAGMNATGDSDLRNYYDMLGAKQNLELAPGLWKLDEVLVRSSLGTMPDGLWWEFAPLWQLSETDKADRDLKRAQTLQAYVGTGIMPEPALQAGAKNRIIEDGVYPGIEEAWKEVDAREALLAPEPMDPAAPANANEPAALPAPRRAANDAAPRSLYVRRDVLNAAEIIAWAKGQGFTTTLAEATMHVTLIFSRAPVDWMKAGESYGSRDGTLEIPPGGPRLVEKLGDATCLLFNSWELSWRHGALRDMGATSAYDDFQPHVSITFQPPADLDLPKVEPYRGKILLGPEIFEEVDENWAGKVEEE